MKDMELEEMRIQINLLKEKLDRYQIVNDRLLQQSMKNNLGTIRQGERRTIICAILAMILTPLSHMSNGISPFLTVYTIVMLMICIIATRCCHAPLRRRNLMGKDVHTVARAFSRVRHLYKTWLYYVTPFILIPWLTWFIYEYTKVKDIPQSHLIYIYILFITSAVIGVFIGYTWHCKVIDACDDAIRQLSEPEEYSK